MSVQIEYRQATQADAAAIGTVTVASRDRPREHDGTAEGVAGGIAAYMAGTHHPRFALAPRRVWVSEHEGEVVGVIAVHLTTKQAFEAELQTMFVRPDYQRRGIGTELLSLAVEWLCAQGASSMMVGFHYDNPYRDFYLKHGGVLGAPSWFEWRVLEALRSSLQIHR